MYLKLRVKTSAKAEKVEKKAEDLYFISVKEEAERNMANKRVLELIKRIYPGKSVSLVKGHRSPSKIVEIK